MWYSTSTPAKARSSDRGSRKSPSITSTVEPNSARAFSGLRASTATSSPVSRRATCWPTNPVAPVTNIRMSSIPFHGREVTLYCERLELVVREVERETGSRSEELRQRADVRQVHLGVECDE